jgi:hypothetical protein
LAPRLDRREQDLPGAQVHCIISVGHGKRRVVLIEVGVVCSKAVNGLFDRPIPKHVIAAQIAGKRRGVGGMSRPAGIIGPPRQDAYAGVNNTSVIGSVGRRRRRQLA